MPEPAGLRRTLGLRDITLLNISAVIGVRWLAAAAHTGPGSLTLWVVAAVFFFVPSAAVVSRLSQRMPEEGGIYLWTRAAFGDWHGFLCAWCYWVSNLFYFPSLVLAGVVMFSYVFGSQAVLENSPWFAAAAALSIIWIVTLANVVGLDIGKWIGNSGGMATYLAGGGLALAAAVVWLRHGGANQFTLLPAWNLDRLNFLSQIAFAFGGLELGAIMASEIRDPERTLRRAAWLGGSACALFYIVGTMAILVLLPAEQVSVISGLTQAGATAGVHLEMPWLSPLLALLVSIGMVGQLGAWMMGTARLPLVLGVNHFLPEVFGRLHPRWRTPYLSLLFQAAACTVMLLVMQAGENLRTGYQLMVDMSVIGYFIPFLYLFGAGWKYGERSAAAGLAVTVLALLFSFVPPSGTSSPWIFEAKLGTGTALLVGLAWLWFRRRAPGGANA